MVLRPIGGEFVALGGMRILAGVEGQAFLDPDQRLAMNDAHRAPPAVFVEILKGGGATVQIECAGAVDLLEAVFPGGGRVEEDASFVRQRAGRARRALAGGGTPRDPGAEGGQPARSRESFFEHGKSRLRDVSFAGEVVDDLANFSGDGAAHGRAISGFFAADPAREGDDVF